MVDRNELIYDALQTWSPDFPRRVTRSQLWSNAHGETIRLLRESEEREDDSPFISVYSFPDGHTKDDNIPAVDTLFIDFDIENGDYVAGSGDREAWKRDLSELLVRARRVASFMEETPKADCWRASLSGHKGVHLFVDFPTLENGLGSFDQYVAGLNDYGRDLINDLASETGLEDLEDYVDVTSADLGRLCRVPNTIHGGASSSFGEERYCVPVSLGELSSLTADGYEELTKSPREVPWESRSPNQDAGEVITQYVQTSEGKTFARGAGGATDLDWSRVEAYREQSNDDLTLDDVQLLTSDMPCVWAFHLRDDMFQHGNQSHEMESHCIAKLLQNDFPIDVIKEFLSEADEYDERYTEKRIEELIARDFSPYRTEKLLRRAPEFCGYNWCARCQSVIQEDEELQRKFN